MSRYRGARLRVIRRLGSLPGLTQKTSNRNHPPGEHTDRRPKHSQYAVRLMEKQKLRHHYGLSEKQLLARVQEARRSKEATGASLLRALESRLDNIVYRMGVGKSIRASRQMVNHGHILVNGRRVGSSSYTCKPGDRIEVKDRPTSWKLLEQYLLDANGRPVPGHLKVSNNPASGVGIVRSQCKEADIGLPVDPQRCVEYYSRQA